MKKLLNIAFVYTLLALASGVFFREFTKFNNFTENTDLALLHVHLLVLGTFLYLILALFSLNTNLLELKKFSLFQKIYNPSLILMITMILLKGIIEVSGIEMSKGLTAALSGISGISHIILTIAFFFLFKCLKEIELQKS
ncbi:MAG: hypothetical protein CSA18_02300 [Deltaproteobacteria bacterium]|nr:MAG: hypothetical protein CSB21_01165 [Deltaproteobacteria bacterium]PIE74962.1 MAG: hypothetical protein CSA18_02300 [Deltaproteobacteria bacterium]